MTDESAESISWDRIGRLMEQAAASSAELSKKNVALWGQVSSHLRAEKYTADAMADDSAKMMAAAMDNMATIWSLWTTPTRQNNVASVMPTAFLLFDRTGPVQHRLLDPVRIEVPPDVARGRTLPDTAKIALNGTASVPSGQQVLPGDRTSAEGVGKLLKCIIARRDSPAPVYLLETLNYEISKDDPGLVPGVYDGLLYLIDPPLPLANIRILVEGEPAPVVSEETQQTSGK